MQMNQCVGNFTYYTNAALFSYASIVADQIPKEELLGRKILPEREVNAVRIISRRPDFIRGLQQFRDTAVPAPKLDDYFNRFGKFCSLETNEWAEYDDIYENEIAEGVSPTGCGTEPINVNDLIDIRMAQLVNREEYRKEFNRWNAMIFGRYDAEKDGQVVATHTYPIRYALPAFSWADPLNSTPIADVRHIRLLFRGLRLKLDKNSWFVVNQKTLDCLLNNLNPKDLGKIVVSACCEALTPDNMNKRFIAFDLPPVTVYDEGYWSRSGFHPFVPDGYAVLIARHADGVPLGYYDLTRHGRTCGNGGIGGWTLMDDNCGKAGETRRIRIEKGHSGVVEIIYPEAFIVIPTGCI